MSKWPASTTLFRLFRGTLGVAAMEVIEGEYPSYEEAEEAARRGWWGKAVTDKIYFRIEKIFVHPDYQEEKEK